MLGGFEIRGHDTDRADYKSDIRGAIHGRLASVALELRMWTSKGFHVFVSRKDSISSTMKVAPRLFICIPSVNNTKWCFPEISSKLCPSR